MSWVELNWELINIFDILEKPRILSSKACLTWFHIWHIQKGSCSSRSRMWSPPHLSVEYCWASPLWFNDMYARFILCDQIYKERKIFSSVPSLLHLFFPYLITIGIYILLFKLYIWHNSTWGIRISYQALKNKIFCNFGIFGTSTQDHQVWPSLFTSNSTKFKNRSFFILTNILASN